MVIAVLLLSVAAFLGVYREIVNRRIAALERRPDSIPQSITPIRFSVLSRTEDVISARVTFLDRQGKEIRTIERSWSGFELVFRVAELKLGTAAVPFPSRIATDSVTVGLPVFEYYNLSGFPAIYRTDSIPDRDKRDLSASFRAVRTTWFLKASRTRLTHVSVGLSDFEPGASYDLVCSSDGSVKIAKE
jgi:hypothetical protein